ncbi:Uncharacterized protein SCF082_LOCUS6866 [Durusdinium trenchii]|uniref:Uncharacterized protein n=1 Tax=Durusdinium trenchii TaxID=1381693 RepID=A0ABP0IFA6_9DINO
MKLFPDYGCQHSSKSDGFLGGEPALIALFVQENQRLGQSKWKLSKVLEGIEAGSSACGVEKLKQHAMKGLRDKAINRMKLQGVSKDQQEVILEEMDALLRERSESAKASAEMESNEFSTENVQESDLFRVQEEAEESAEMEDSRMQESTEPAPSDLQEEDPEVEPSDPMA